jgi:hypothetical protein
LQVIVGDKSFYLPCQKVSELLKVSKMTVSRYRRWAVEDTYLRIVEDAKFRSKGRSEATEFRFDVSRWSCLRTKAQDGSEASFANAAKAVTP